MSSFNPLQPYNTLPLLPPDLAKTETIAISAITRDLRTWHAPWARIRARYRPIKSRFAFITALKKLIAAAGLEDEKFSKYGIKKSDIPALAHNALTAMSGGFKVTPVKQEQADVERIFTRAYS